MRNTRWIALLGRKARASRPGRRVGLLRLGLPPALLLLREPAGLPARTTVMPSAVAAAGRSARCPTDGAISSGVDAVDHHQRRPQVARGRQRAGRTASLAFGWRMPPNPTHRPP